MRKRSFVFLLAAIGAVFTASFTLAKLPEYNLLNSHSGAATRSAEAYQQAVAQEEWDRLDDEFI